MIYLKSELFHHGVKGMKWGVRNDKDPKRAINKRVAKEGKKTYGISYNRFGAGTTIRDSSGKKMKYRTQRAVEKTMRRTNKEEYRKYKYYKNLANSGATYVGSSATMALAVTAINTMSANSRANAKVTAQKMIIDNYNVYVKDIKR